MIPRFFTSAPRRTKLPHVGVGRSGGRAGLGGKIRRSALAVPMYIVC